MPLSVFTVRLSFSLPYSYWSGLKNGLGTNKEKEEQVGIESEIDLNSWEKFIS